MLAPPGEPGCGGNIRPLGITGTPVVDGITRTLYVAAMQAGNKHMIYALSLSDGSTVPGWPVDVSTIRAGAASFNPAFQHQRGALLLLNGTLYVPYGGNFQDCGEFHGWVVGIPVANPAAPTAFVTRGIGGGIWAPGGLASDGVSVFAATGNTLEKAGAINSSPATWGHGNAVLRLSPALADIAELEYQQKLGRSVDKDEVEAVAADVMVLFRQQIENQAHRLAAQVIGKDIDATRALIKQDGNEIIAAVWKELDRRVHETGAQE